MMLCDQIYRNYKTFYGLAEIWHFTTRAQPQNDNLLNIIYNSEHDSKTAR